MRRRTITLLAVLAALGAPACALAATGTVTVDGFASKLCVLGAPDPGSIDLGELSSATGPNPGHLQTISDHNVQLPDSFCNYADTELTVDASALLATDTSVQTGFTRAVNFTATVADWGSTNAAATTAAAADGTNPTASGTSGAQTAPKDTDLTLTLSNFTAPGGSFLISGDYQGSVTVTIGPK